MARKATRGKTPQRTNWTRRITIMASIVFIVGVCVALKNYSGPQDAQAQIPGSRAARPSNAASDTAAQTPRAQTPAVRPQPSNVAAAVNGQQISRQELADLCLLRYGKEVLESLVNKHLIWQACKSHEISITNENVEAEVTRLAGKFGLTKERWLAMLQDERDITPEQYRQEIIWPSLALRALAATQLVVSPQELQKAFESEYGPRVKARAITVSSRQTADEIQAKAAQNPDDFGALAKQYSEDQSASVHGVIPPIRKHLGDENIERVAFALQEGEVSPVLQVANQYVILKCEKHLPETYISQRFRADAEARVRDRIQDQKLRGAAASLFQKLQADARVVNVFNDEALKQQMPGVAATINGQKLAIQQLAEECIQRHGRDVLESEINRRLLQQALKKKSLTVTEADLQVEIARAADAYGYVQTNGAPDIEKWLTEVTKESEATVELYVRDVVWPTVALKKLVDGRVNVSEADIQKGFESNYGPRVEILAIVLNDMRQAQKVWEMARNNPTDQFFGGLAQQYSTDPVSRENFGRVPPIRQHGGRPILEKEAFSLKPGPVTGLSGIIASDDKFVILRCTGHTNPVVQAMDAAVRDELVKDIREKKLRLAMAVEFDRQQESATVDNYLAGTFRAPRPPQGMNPGAARPIDKLPRR